MKITLHLTRPYEYDAYALFLAELSKRQAAEEKESPKHSFGINRDEAVFWGTRAPEAVEAVINATEETAPAAAEPEVKAEAPKRGRGKKAETAPQISTEPENRVGPEDDADTAAQDKADEQAELEATRQPAKELTHDDVKAAAAGYIRKFGMEAAQEDGVNIFNDTLGAPPEGAAGWRIGIIPNDQHVLQNVVDAWSKAGDAENRYVKKARA